MLLMFLAGAFLGFALSMFLYAILGAGAQADLASACAACQTIACAHCEANHEAQARRYAVRRVA